jgi:ABC-type Na+ transport system ATPase subunit NatA
LNNILEVRNLEVSFFTHFGEVQAVRDISFSIGDGEVLGIVGESGSGKSITAFSVMGLIEHPGKIKSGSIVFGNQDLIKKTRNEMQKIRGNDISIIFQDPMTSLNPVLTIKNMMVEIIRQHQRVSKKEALARAIEMLGKYIGKENNVGLVSFSDNVNINLPIAKFDINQMSLFTGAVTDLQAQGNTAMFDAIAVASKMLLDAKAKDPNTKLMLFVLTDGETNRGHSLNDMQDVLKTFKIPVYTIGYNANISVLKTSPV